LSRADVQPPPGLPEPLPEGERIVWQRSPAWRPYARRVFHFNKIALYFALLIAWIAGSAYAGSGELQDALRALGWAAPPAVGVLLVLGLLGWGYARTTTYTVTNKRIVIQSGLAFPASINLPFARIDSADLRTHADGTGDIELSLAGERVLYSMLWPNVRMLRVSKPRPVLRALTDPAEAAGSLGRALASDQQPATDPGGEARGRAEAERPATA
jgi:hypothetical protein